MYTPKSQDCNLKNIENEIRVYEALSNRAGPNNCFLKYYGTAFEKNSIYLVMEYIKEDLNKFIDHHSKNSQMISQNVLLSSFSKLKI